jgi:hypothetical protein
MKQRFLSLLTLCAFAGPVLADPPAGCGPQTTKGAWVYTCEGTLPAPAQTAARILGRCSASASGYFDCKGTVNLGGLIVAQALQGQAVTLPNCTGTISYAQSLGGSYVGQLDIQYVVSDGGAAIDGLPVNSGGVLSCSLKRIDGKRD